MYRLLIVLTVGTLVACGGDNINDSGIIPAPSSQSSTASRSSLLSSSFLSSSSVSSSVASTASFAAVIASSDSSSFSSVSSITSPVSTTNKISYYDDLIVFHFAQEYPYGRFANGDYWVHNYGNDVVIQSISPASVTEQERTRHGTMVNPPDSTSQGYDSSPRDMAYKPELNVDPGKTGAPLIVAAGSSVVKAISMESDAGRPIISDAVVLTVLSETPPENAFRPAYTGVDKSIIATVADLDYTRLGHHPLVGGEPDIDQLAKGFERVWLEHCTQWVQRDIHLLNNMPAYGRDLANRSGSALISLQLDYTDQQKQKLLIGLVQYGLDIYGVALDGGEWYANGGHNLGRKLPLLLAGYVLNDSNILAYADAEQHFIFQDDQQHFYVSQTEVDITHSSSWAPDNRAEPVPYEQSDIGMAEWGIRHADRPTADNRAWGATYRNVNGFAQTKHIFAARLMGVQDQWNWPAVFDYADRYYETESDGFSDHFNALWQAYRNDL